MSKLVGILNITPDSFSDAGKYFAPEAALEHAKQMVYAGAYALDIGAESTRPGATLLTPDEEWKRLQPILELLHQHLPNTLLSLDTRHVETLKNALPYGIRWINDVSGFQDPSMLEYIRDTTLELILMHNLGVPADKQVTLPAACNPVTEVMQWLQENIRRLEQYGLSRQRIIADPGIGFGKTAEQSLALVQNASTFKALGVRILFGHSEKSFLSLLTSNSAGERQEATTRVSAWLAQQDIDYLRVHDIANNLYALHTRTKVTL